jgi:hypothetical protein
MRNFREKHGPNAAHFASVQLRIVTSFRDRVTLELPGFEGEDSPAFPAHLDAPRPDRLT